MTEYTRKDIIMDPNDPRLKEAIGKKVYCSSDINLLLQHANDNEHEKTLTQVEDVDSEPFIVTDMDGDEIDADFIIIKKEEPKPKYVPFETLDEFIESYKKAEERIDYSNAKDYIASCGMWLRFNNDVMCAVTEIWTDGVFLGTDRMKIKWKELFNICTFLDGSPCGKEVK